MNSKLKIYATTVGIPLLLVITAIIEIGLQALNPYSYDWMYLLPIISAISGTIALVIVLLGLSRIKFTVQRAMRSRADLLLGFKRSQRLMPWLLGSSNLAVVISAIPNIAFITLFLMMTLNIRAPKLLFAITLLLIFLLWGAVKAVYRMVLKTRAALDDQPMRVSGNELTPEMAPKLWEWVRSIANNLNTSPPDRIVMGMDQGFFVTEHPVALNQQSILQGKTLYIPLPHMAFLSQDEAATIIGHELGHFIGQDTEYSLHFAPIYKNAVTNLRLLAEGEDEGYTYRFLNKPILMLGVYFLDAFDEAVQHWSRLRELEADKLGAQLSSPQHFAQALLRVVVLDGPIQRVLNKMWTNGGKLEHDLLTEIELDIQANGLEDPKGCLEHKLHHPTDSHPTVFQRLQSLNIQADEPLFERARATQRSDLLQRLGLSDETPQTDSAVQASTGAPSSIEKALQSSFQAEITQSSQEHIKQLEALANTKTAPLAVKEGFITKMFGGLVIAMIGLGLIFCLALIPDELSRRSIDITNIFMYLVLAAGGVVVVIFAIKRLRDAIKQSKEPFLTLDTNGLGIITSLQPLAWEQINDFEISEQSTNGVTQLTMKVYLMSDAAAPTFEQMRQRKYDAKKQCITLNLINPKVDGEDIYKTFTALWTQAKAKQELASFKR